MREQKHSYNGPAVFTLGERHFDVDVRIDVEPDRLPFICLVDGVVPPDTHLEGELRTLDEQVFPVAYYRGRFLP